MLEGGTWKLIQNTVSKFKILKYCFSTKRIYALYEATIMHDSILEIAA